MVEFIVTEEIMSIEAICEEVIRFPELPSERYSQMEILIWCAKRRLIKNTLICDCNQMFQLNKLEVMTDVDGIAVHAKLEV